MSDRRPCFEFLMVLQIASANHCNLHLDEFFDNIISLVLTHLENFFLFYVFPYRVFEFVLGIFCDISLHVNPPRFYYPLARHKK